MKNMLFDMDEAVERLQISKESLYRYILMRKIIPVKQRGRNFFTEEELSRFEQARKDKQEAWERKMKLA